MWGKLVDAEVLRGQDSRPGPRVHPFARGFRYTFMRRCGALLVSTVIMRSLRVACQSLFAFNSVKKVQRDESVCANCRKPIAAKQHAMDDGANAPSDCVLIPSARNPQIS